MSLSFVQAVPELLSEPVERWAEYYFGPPASPDAPSREPYEGDAVYLCDIRSEENLDEAGLAAIVLLRCAELHGEIRRVLDVCRSTGEFVAYHKWGDTPDIFLVGVVRDLTDTKVTFANVDPRGRFEDDNYAVALRLIHTLDRDTFYIRRLKILNDLEPEEETESEDVRKPAKIRALLDRAAEERAIVRLRTSADEANDFIILAVGERTVTVSSVTDGGPEDGRTTLRLKRVVRALIGPSERDDARVFHHTRR